MPLIEWRNGKKVVVEEDPTDISWENYEKTGSYYIRGPKEPPPPVKRNWGFWLWLALTIIFFVVMPPLPTTLHTPNPLIKPSVLIEDTEEYTGPVLVMADVAEKWQFDFQDPASPIMEGIINLHHDLMFFLIIIAVFVLWVLLRTVFLFDRSKGHEPSKVVHGTVLEIIWTIAPSFILLAVAIPSFALLYAMDEASDPAITIKVIGRQWYWVYEYSDYSADSKALAFESYMIPEEELKVGQLRLLEVDNRIFVPTNTHIRFLITSADVLHSWAVPALGIKVDACPGRLNQATVFIKRDGIYYGQCSEICGVNHAFMPIVVESVPLDEYVSWVANKIEA